MDIEKCPKCRSAHVDLLISYIHRETILPDLQNLVTHACQNCYHQWDVDDVAEVKTYQELAARTLIDAPDFEIDDRNMMVIWNAIGLAGEAGEVADLVKKGIFHQHGLDVGALKKELGDCLWYIAAICTKLGLDLNEVMAENIAKLEARYPSGYSSEDSIKRVDE